MARWTATRRTLHDLRAASELAHVRPAYAAGFRAAIATVAPLLLGPLLPAGAGTWMSLAGLNGALIDRGGPYRTRAMTMSALAIASGIAATIGALVHGHIVVAVLVTFALAAFSGLSRAWADVGPGFGVTILVTYAISVAVPSPSLSAALLRGGFIVAGGLWALLLAIFLWPIRPYRPVRLRIAECYRSIARFVEAAADEIATRASHDPSAFRPHVIAVRNALEAARIALAASRLGRMNETRRGERLLVLHEIADQLFAHALALLEESETLLSTTPHSLHDRLAHVLRTFASMLRAIASAIESESDVPRIPVRFNGTPIRPYSEATGEIVDRMADYASTATALVASLNSGAPAPAGSENIDVAEPLPEPPLFSLRAVLRPDSILAHHALRVAIVTSAAVLVSAALHLNHDYWVTLTAVVILQPFAAATRQKAFQRIIGTILGAIVAAGLTALFQSEIAVISLVAVFTFLCVAMLPLNYGAYAVFGTPAFVLLAEVSAGDWHLARLRIVNTLIGGALALVGSRLWPGDEWLRLPDFAAKAIRGLDHMVAQALELVAEGATDVGPLRDARREVGLAVFNAEDSFQRLISEHRGGAETLEAVMTFLVFTRRIGSSTNALALASHPTAHPTRAALEPFGRATHAILSDLADAVSTGRVPAPFPSMGSVVLPDPSVNKVVHQRLTRIARQLKLLHDTVARWMGDTTSVSVVRSGDPGLDRREHAVGE